jgi:hypothetical protein
VCFSATANFVGSGVLGTIGVVTLTRVKHRRELLFAALPALVKRYAFTSLWCAYAAVASVIILIYFWRSSPDRPFLYAQ